MGRILVGATSWGDRSLLGSGWYPPSVRTAEGRLHYYAERFPITEVDSSYYALPSERNSHLWVERTPNDFVFDVKAFSLFTQHPTRRSGLPGGLQTAAPDKERLYIGDLPGSAVDEIWDMFRSALRPLHDAGKLGSVLLQFPEWFVPSGKNKDYILEAARRLEPYRAAVELRRSSWLLPDPSRERTLRFLEENRLAYVCVDMPQGFRSSLPAVVAVTNPELSVVRFHGRDPAAWSRKGGTAAERFRYHYDRRELAEWVPRVRSLAGRAGTVHVLFNNCHRDSAVRNARDLVELLDGSG